MTSVEKSSIFKHLFLMLWAMGTLVLFFVVGLLINEMVSNGANPLAAFSPEKEMPAATRSKTIKISSLGTKEISLYFTSEDGHWLTPENRVIEYRSHTVENCRKALDGLLNGPQNEQLFPLLPAQTEIRALYLLPDGELTIDISSEILTSPGSPKSAEMEALMIYGIINTLTQPVLQAPEGTAVKTVRFLFDGASPQESFPAHLDLSAPLEQDDRWTRINSE
ncbi:MAG: GerMN domain-containing protein [Candidatus Hydrogenedentes bacterium]|nr:GerMN domain-containing protein [Candidatus Hydrogenedentota bacterium]